MTLRPLKPSSELTETDGSVFVDLYRKSGLTQAAFCKQHGLSLSSLKNWSYRCKSQGDVKGDGMGRPTKDEREDDASVLFKPVRVDDDLCGEDFSSLPQPPFDKGPLIQIDLSLFRISVPNGFDSDTLRRILSIVKAC